MKAKHTPGPWTAEKSPYCDNGEWDVGSQMRVIARTNNCRGNAEANARLIASAPKLKADRDKLLEACEIFVRHIELHENSNHPKANMFCTECPTYVNTFRSAIAEAEAEKGD